MGTELAVETHVRYSRLMRARLGKTTPRSQVVALDQRQRRTVKMNTTAAGMGCDLFSFVRDPVFASSLV